MIVKVGFLVVASVATFAVSKITIDSSSRKRNSGIKPSANDDSSFQQEGIKEEDEDKSADSNFSVEEKQEEVVGKKCTSKMKANLHEKRDYEEFEFPIHDKKLDKVNETRLLQKIVREVEQRKVTIEGKLLELSDLKVQQSYIANLQRNLQAKMEKINMLNMTINFLQAERKELHEEMKQNLLAEKQLEIAKKKIMEMEAKIMCNDENKMKEQLIMLKKQVSGFQREETSIRDDAMVEKNLKSVKDVELEVLQLKRRNKELQLEKRELAVKLVAAETRIMELSNKTETQIISKVEEEICSLQHANKNLTKQVEKLQKSRFGMVEELVYQRWLNTCLKLERQDYRNPSIIKIPKRNLSNSSHTSSTESYETDSTIIYSSSSSNKKSTLIQKIKRWGRRKDNSSVVPSIRNGLIRRFSTSMIPSSSTSMVGKKEEQENCTESPETPSCFPRVRRVSFNDSVTTFMFEDTEKSDDQEVFDERSSGHGSTMESGHGSTMRVSFHDSVTTSMFEDRAKSDDQEVFDERSSSHGSTIRVSFNDSVTTSMFEDRAKSDDQELFDERSSGHGLTMDPGNNGMVEAQMGSEIKVAHTAELQPTVLSSENKVGIRIVFFFFFLMLVIYFLICTARI